MTNFKAFSRVLRGTLFTASDIIIDIATVIAALTLLIVKSAQHPVELRETSDNTQIVVEVVAVEPEPTSEPEAVEPGPPSEPGPEPTSTVITDYVPADVVTVHVRQPRQRFTSTQVDDVALWLDTLPVRN